MRSNRVLLMSVKERSQGSGFGILVTVSGRFSERV